MRQAATIDHAARYRGKNLFFLLLSICGPAALLYARIVFGIAAQRAPWLASASFVALCLFFPAQVVAAWYFRRLLPPVRSAWAEGLQFIGLFFMGLFLSITGAVILEAFGFTAWNRFAPRDAASF